MDQGVLNVFIQTVPYFTIQGDQNLTIQNVLKGCPENYYIKRVPVITIQGGPKLQSK